MEQLDYLEIDTVFKKSTSKIKIFEKGEVSDGDLIFGWLFF